MKRKKVFFDESPEFILKVSVAAYLEMLAMKFGWKCSVSSDGVFVSNEDEYVFHAGIVKDCEFFVSLLAKTEYLRTDKELASWIMEADPTVGELSDFDPDYTLFIFDPVKKSVQDAICSYYEENWARMFSKFLDCGAQGDGVHNSIFALIGDWGESIGVLERVERDLGDGLKKRIQIIPNRPFVAEGIEQHLFGESKEFKRFYKYFDVQKPVPVK